MDVSSAMQHRAGARRRRRCTPSAAASRGAGAGAARTGRGGGSREHAEQEHGEHGAHGVDAVRRPHCAEQARRRDRPIAGLGARNPSGIAAGRRAATRGWGRGTHLAHASPPSTESATLAVDAKAKALKAAGENVIGFGAGRARLPDPAAHRRGRRRRVPRRPLPPLFADAGPARAARGDRAQDQARLRCRLSRPSRCSSPTAASTPSTTPSRCCATRATRCCCPRRTGRRIPRPSRSAAACRSCCRRPRRPAFACRSSSSTPRSRRARRRCCSCRRATRPARCTRPTRSRRSGAGRSSAASGSSPTRSTSTSPTTATSSRRCRASCPSSPTRA